MSIHFLFRTVLELILAAALLVWLLLLGLPSIQRDEFIYCKVHSHKYECAGHPQQFYMYVLFIALVLLAAYLFCCFYNILWLVIPQLGTLSRVMRKYKQEARKNAKDPSGGDEAVLGDLHSVYYSNLDLKLLLDLLAESSGIAPSIRIMSLFDKRFRSGTEPRSLSVRRLAGGTEAEVEFEDAPTLVNIFANIEQVACIYTVEIRPSTAHSSCVAFKFGAGKGGKGGLVTGLALEPKNVIVNAVSGGISHVS